MKIAPAVYFSALVLSARALLQIMKLCLVIICALGLACSAPKVEPSSASRNATPEPLQNSPSTSVAPPEQPSTQPSNCSLTKSAAPIINGLKLGMTPTEVLAVLPGSKDDMELQSQLSRPATPLGVSNFVIHAEKLKPPDRFTGITQFTFNVLDGHVYSLNVGYKAPTYSHVDEFVTKFIEGTNLPPADQWQPQTGMETQLKSLSCRGFEVRVFAGGKGSNLNYVLLTDLDADKQLKNRRAKARAQLSSTAVPSP